MISAYIFDMDGVICDSEEFVAAAACQMFKRVYETVVKPEDFRPFIGTGEARFIGGVADKYGVSLMMPRDKDTTYQIYAELVQGRLQAIPGVVEFMKNAAAQGIKLALATSADVFKLNVNLAAIGVDQQLFNVIVSGNEITNKKPAPDIFLKATQLLGVDPTRAVVFEDALTGVQAAKSAGCWCVGVTTSFSAEMLSEAGADRTISDFTQNLNGLRFE